MTNAVKILDLLNTEIRYYELDDEFIFAMADVLSLFGLPKNNHHYARQRHISEENRIKKQVSTTRGDRDIWFLRVQGIKEICFAMPEKGVFVLDAFYEATFPCAQEDDWTDDFPEEYDDDVDAMEEIAELEKENDALREKLNYSTRQLDKALKALGISMLMDTPCEIYD